MTIMKYTIGFVLSLVLTLIAYGLVVGGPHSPWLVAALIVLAVVQMVVQLIFFLHLGDETGPRWKLWSYVFMGGTLLILVLGSLWIMYNMNYNMAHMTSDEKSNYMRTQYDKGF